MYHREELEGILSHRTAIAVVVLIVLPLALPVSADWLVTRDGGRVETRGAWSIRGKLVVFELPNGSLASLALADVDLDASAVATEAARRAAEAPVVPEPAPPAEAVLSITDDDVEHADPGDFAARDGSGVAVEGSAGGSSGSEAGEPEEAAPAEHLVVTTWDQSSDPDVEGVLVTGRLANQSDQAKANIELVLQLFDSESGLLGSVPAVLTATTLLPGQSARFRAEARDIFAFQAVRFDVSSLALETRRDETEEEPVPE